jgi:hypothetical protein
VRSRVLLGVRDEDVAADDLARCRQIIRGQY